MKVLQKIALAVGAALVAGSSYATVVATSGSYDGGGQTLQDYLNTWSGGAVSSNFVNTNQYTPDETWAIGGTHTSAIAYVFELTGNSGNNTFGIYDLANPANKLEIYDPAETNSGQRALLVESILTPGLFSTYLLDSGGLPASTPISITLGSGASTFGLYMGAGGLFFYSQAALNFDGGDQMVAYQGSGQTMSWPYDIRTSSWLANEILLAWEDLNVGTNSSACGVSNDCDYQDMVILMESIHSVSVPVPASAALLGIGLLGLAGFAGRRRA